MSKNKPEHYGSIYRKYKKGCKYKSLHENDIVIYFTNTKLIRYYSKKLNDILFEWVEEAIKPLLILYLNTNVYNWVNGKNGESLKIIEDAILRGVKEIVYNKIRNFGNIVCLSTLQGIATTAIMISFTVILGIDLLKEEPLIRDFTAYTKNSLSVKHMKLMEINIYTTTDWQPCKKVCERLSKKNNLNS